MASIITRRRVFNVLLISSVLVATGLFFFQVNLHLLRFLNHVPVTSVTLQLPDILHLPPIVICPDQPFNLDILKGLGLYIKAPSQGQHAKTKLNIVILQGLDHSLPAREVWENAGFLLGEVVHSLSFSDVLESYTEQTQVSSFWRRLVSPLGSCLALVVPPTTNLEAQLPQITVFLKKFLHQTSYPSKSFNCTNTEAMKSCNSNFASLRTSYYVFLAKTYSIASQRVNSEFYKNGWYLLSEDLWHNVQLGTSKESLNGIEVATTIIEKYSLTCRQATPMASVNDFNACTDLRIETELGCLPVWPYSNITLANACRVSVIQDEIARNRFKNQTCPRPLNSECLQKYWAHEVKHGLDSEAFISDMYKIHLEVRSPMIRTETQVDMYPLSQLASDIGASLVMSLGMSIFSVWKWLHHVPTNLMSKLEFGSRLSTEYCQLLAHRIMITTLTFFTIVHCMLSLKIYISQPAMTSVSYSTVETSNAVPHTNRTIYDHVAARLASRALDCHPSHYPTQLQCTLDCLMAQSVKQASIVAPFVELNDLPQCSSERSWAVSPTYIVPSLALATATDPYLITECEQQCPLTWQTNGSMLDPLSGYTINHKYYQMTVGDLVCSVGGIVGLYAGSCLTSVMPAISRLFPDTPLRKHYLQRLMMLVLKFLIYISGTMLTISLLYRYIFSHPICSSDSNEALTTFKKRMVTVCHWPPFNTQLTNTSLTQDKQWPFVGGFESINRLAFTQGTFTLLDHGECSINASSVLTAMNRCDANSSNPFYRNFVTSLSNWLNYEEFVVFSIHSINEDPPSVSQVYRLNIEEALSLTVIPVRYFRVDQLGSHSSSYGTCFYRCILGRHSNDLGCRLPFVSWRSDVTLCTPERALLHPSWPPEPPDLSLADIPSCHESCRQFLTEFYLVTAKTDFWVESVNNIIPQRNSYINIVETDLYPLSQLVNDLGLVVSFTFGISVLSLLQTVFRIWHHRGGDSAAVSTG